MVKIKRKPNEPDAHYIKRLERQNQVLREDNQRLGEWGTRVEQAVFILSTEGSLVFQAMAEKAGVRSHPSVSEVVSLFDEVATQKWKAKPPKEVRWPTDWDFCDDLSNGNGDADMCLNSPINDILHLDPYQISAQKWRDACSRLHSILNRKIQGIKESHWFRPVVTKPLPKKHYRTMKRSELVDLVESMNWFALDLAQEMHFAMVVLRRDLRATAYRDVARGLYNLSQMAFAPQTRLNIKVFGGGEIK